MRDIRWRSNRRSTPAMENQNGVPRAGKAAAVVSFTRQGQMTVKLLYHADVGTIIEVWVNRYADDTDAADHRGSKPKKDQRKSATSVSSWYLLIRSCKFAMCNELRSCGKVS